MLPTTKWLDSFAEVDFAEYELPFIAVYDNPTDVPGLFVARIYDFVKSTPYAIKKLTLDEIRDAIPPTFRNIGRNWADDPVIVEVWL